MASHEWQTTERKFCKVKLLFGSFCHIFSKQTVGFFDGSQQTYNLQRCTGITAWISSQLQWKLHFILWRSSLHLFLHLAVQIYEIHNIIISSLSLLGILLANLVNCYPVAQLVTALHRYRRRRPSFDPGGGGVLPYMTYTGMSCPTG